MKAYFSAQIRLVPMQDDIITSSSVQVGTPFTSDNHIADAPRRRSIWD